MNKKPLMRGFGELIVIGALAAAALIGGIVYSHFHQAPSSNVGSTIPVTPAVFETILASGIGTSDTSMTLASGALRDGSLISGYYCFTIDSGTPALEYVCGMASSTSITNLVRGIDPITGTTTNAALAFSHRRGADVKVTDYPTLGILSRIANGLDTFPNTLSYGSAVPIATSSNQIVYASYLFNNYPALSASNTITGANTYTGSSTFTNVVNFTGTINVPFNSASSSAASVGYVNSVAVAGAPNASSTVKGIVQEATLSDIQAGNSSGSTGARLYINPSFVTSTTTGNSIPLLNSSGMLNTGTYQPPSIIDNTPVNSLSAPTVTGTPTFIGTSTQMRIGNAASLWLLYDPTFSTTGLMTQIPAVNSSSTNAEYSAINLGNQIFDEELDNTSSVYGHVFYAYNRATAATTTVTFSGLTPGATTTNSLLSMSSDGTNIYINYDNMHTTNSCVVDKYSVSGTTLTFVASTTLGTIKGNACTTIFYVSPVTGNYYVSGAGDSYIRAFSSTGTAIATSSQQYSGLNNLGAYNINGTPYISTTNFNNNGSSAQPYSFYGALNLK